MRTGRAKSGIGVSVLMSRIAIGAALTFSESEQDVEHVVNDAGNIIVVVICCGKMRVVVSGMQCIRIVRGRHAALARSLACLM